MSSNWNLTRRQVVKSLAVAAGAQAIGRLAFSQAGTQMTAAQIVDAIKKNLNMQWDEKGFRDTFKAGDPNTPVKGIAVSFMSTFDVLKKAHAQGLNFVITHEPTFWTDPDLIEPVKDDPLYQEKRRFIESNGMVVWRIHDHWHRVRPEPMSSGVQRLMGWTPAEPGKRVYKIAPTKLRDLASQFADKDYSRSVRFVGDPELTVTTVTLGGHELAQNIAALNQADVAIASEVREWDSVEYARDMVAAGEKKALIVISHEAGEEEGMVLFAEWMKKVTPEIRTLFIPANDLMYFV